VRVDVREGARQSRRVGSEPRLVLHPSQGRRRRRPLRRGRM